MNEIQGTILSENYHPCLHHKHYETRVDTSCPYSSAELKVTVILVLNFGVNDTFLCNNSLYFQTTLSSPQGWQGCSGNWSNWWFRRNSLPSMIENIHVRVRDGNTTSKSSRICWPSCVVFLIFSLFSLKIRRWHNYWWNVKKHFLDHYSFQFSLYKCPCPDIISSHSPNHSISITQYFETLFYIMNQSNNFVRIAPNGRVPTFRCELCRRPHDASYGSGRFCSSKCARTMGGNATKRMCQMKDAALKKKDPKKSRPQNKTSNKMKVSSLLN